MKNNWSRIREERSFAIILYPENLKNGSWAPYPANAGRRFKSCSRYFSSQRIFLLAFLFLYDETFRLHTLLQIPQQNLHRRNCEPRKTIVRSQQLTERMDKKLPPVDNHLFRSVRYKIGSAETRKTTKVSPGKGIYSKQFHPKRILKMPGGLISGKRRT